MSGKPYYETGADGVIRGRDSGYNEDYMFNRPSDFDVQSNGVAGPMPREYPGEFAGWTESQMIAELRRCNRVIERILESREPSQLDRIEARLAAIEGRRTPPTIFDVLSNCEGLVSNGVINEARVLVVYRLFGYDASIKAGEVVVK